MHETGIVVKVGIADLNIVFPPNTIRTSGLGSCVGVVLYDPPKQVAGLAHIMLPDSTMNKQKTVNNYKYADTAIDILIERLCASGARKHVLKAKLAGGAQMFQFSSASEIMRIGPRNVEAVKGKLRDHQIPIVASDVGGNCGRTIEFNPETGKLKIRTINQGEACI
ncbi:chemotaxis protein CheD [Virgibacillus dakarensis]|uniref:Probable chemoreceptor glutamine deamidase CheD n=1 Tax=Lentibacillus populi TaxID=1827502 RepID=A0A9W5X4D4_9BACI|nr:MULTISPECIES: chemotaxis protein CheD [Bacillaceae]MTW84958.1 chemotaxis protein CheD [Virgibacillus dakarensis]GGB30487.1 chemoreceptor glutamine deamidase CheD [Lentibacillus populi]